MPNRLRQPSPNRRAFADEVNHFRASGHHTVILGDFSNYAAEKLRLASLVLTAER